MSNTFTTRASVCLALVVGLACSLDLDRESRPCNTRSDCLPGQDCDIARRICVASRADGQLLPDAGEPDTAHDQQVTPDTGQDSQLDTVSCAFGKREDGACKQLAAANGLQIDYAATDDLLVTKNMKVDTNKCEVATLMGQLVGSMCVLSLRRLRVAQGVTLSASGKNHLVVLASEEVTVDGTVDVGAHGTKAGPGGGAGGIPPNGNGKGEQGGRTCGCSTLETDDCGGGGGGHGTAGARGGDDGESCATHSLGGGKYGAASLVPLTAGSGGASAGQATPGEIPGAGGAGGGGLQISCAGTFTINGAISAGGGGGGVGPTAGGGGGSGGGILVEAGRFGGTGVVAANGGGGGAGRDSGCSTSSAGQDGRAALAAAKGGSGCSRPGGDGGAKGSLPKNGSVGGGGGGGAAGWIRLNTHDTQHQIKSSPLASVGTANFQ